MTSHCLSVLRIVMTSAWILLFALAISEANFGMKRRSHKETRQAECKIPAEWSGDWVQHDTTQHTLRLDKSNFLASGKCIDSAANSDKEHTFVIEDAKDRCYRAFVIHEKHPNVLQYRKSMCLDKPQDSKLDPNKVRYQIESDSPTVLLIRVNATPERCPLQHQSYRFSYNRNHGECVSPPSRVDQCNQNNTKLLFRFQACADVIGTESSTEELTCIAGWRDGQHLYFIGKMIKKNAHIRNHNDASHYRCYIYQHDPEAKTTYIAESADATCYGVYSATEGSRVMKLHTVDSPPPQCSFPLYMLEKEKEKRPIWLKINKYNSAGDSKTNFIFNSTLRELTIKEDGDYDARAVCIQQMVGHNPDEINGTFSYVVEYQQKCETSFRCMTFHRRSEHVVELQIGSPAITVKEACYQPYYDKDSRTFDTLYRAAPRRCVLHGNSFKVVGKLQMPLDHCGTGHFSTLGCIHKSSMVFYTSCGSYKFNNHFVCYGHYRRGNSTYMIAEEEGKGTVCFAYTRESKYYTLKIYQDQCPRSHEPELEAHMRLQVLQNQNDCDNNLDTASRAAMASSATSQGVRKLLCLLSTLVLIMLR
ncbi:uncharacterized protein LOC100899747 [Galendromus occidentalis]|uniref:Uncharacterized protein LOC100899747 n=1 Tax=Galendromus occidentalis TaxID=34638 RepID=A0AAJ7SEZ6_9ACAR|nr:uncharacterized protein LOC100899747 [Galendromus occidentalis]